MARAVTQKTRQPGVFRRAEDDRLIVRAKVVSPKTGKPVDREQLCPPGTTLSQAVRLRLDMIEKIKSGLDEVNEIPTLKAYAEKWADRKVRGGEWREGATSEVIVRGVLRNHIIPVLGDYFLHKITVADLQAWMDGQIAEGGRPVRDPGCGKTTPTPGNPSSVRLRWVILSSLIKDGCDEHGLRSPTVALRTPKKLRKVHKAGADMVLMPLDVARFVDDVEPHEPEWLPTVLLGFATGARPSELVPARVGDLDLDDPSGIGKWTIHRHFGYMAAIIGGTKTTDEKPRVVFVDREITARLKELLKHRFPAEYIVTGRSAQGTCDKSGMTRMIRRVARRLGLSEDLAGKMFRQTHATLSRIQGVPDLVLQAQLGHKSSQTTDIYTRCPEQALRDARARIVSLIPKDTTGEAVGAEVGVAEVIGE